MTKIKYIAFYPDFSNNTSKRLFAYSAKNKIDYLIQTLNEINISVNLISASYLLRNGFLFGKKTIFGLNSVQFLPSLNIRIFKKNFVAIIFAKITLFIYLFFNLKFKEKIIVYHSNFYSSIVKFFVKFRKIKVILELEEVYGDFVKTNDFQKISEYLFLKNNQNFILSSPFLKKIIPPYSNSIVISGSYIAHKSVKKFEDGKIHLVYSGTLLPQKGSSLLGDLGEILPENYILHILSPDDNLFKKLKQIYIFKENIVFHGHMVGEDFYNFLSKCDIGLNLQSPSAQYNFTSFPSKILSYISSNLIVVSPDIEAIKNSLFASKIVFTKDYSPKAFLESIIANKNNIVDNNKFICELHHKAKIDLRILLQYTL